MSPSTSGETFDNLNPATGEVLCRVEQAGAAEVERAVASAQAGFAVWSAMTGAERGRILHRAQRNLRARNREIAARRSPRHRQADPGGGSASTSSPAPTASSTTRDSPRRCTASTTS